MPKFAQEKFSAPTMETQDKTQREITKVVASPVSTYVRPAESNLLRLSEALGQFSGQVFKAVETHEEIEGEKEELLGFKANKAGEAMSPEAHPRFQQGFMKAHWDGVASKAEAEATEEYFKNRDNPEFNIDSFLQQRIQKDMQGVTGTDALKIYQQRFGRLGAELRGDFTKHHVKLAYDQRDEAFNVGQSQLLERLSRVEGPGKLDKGGFFTELKNLRTTYKDLGKTNTEMSTALLDAVNAQSRKMKGNTELYDIFYEKDPETGLAMVEMNPKLAEAVEKARHTATIMYDQTMTREAHIRNGDTIESMWDAIRQGRFDEVSDDNLQSHRTQFGALWDNGTYHSIRAARDRGLLDAKLASVGDQAVIEGELWKYKPDVQRGALERITAPEIQTITENLDNADPQAAGDAAALIVKAHATTKASVPSDQIKRLTDTVKQFAPDPTSKDAQVPNRFKNLAAIYEAMKGSTNAGLVDMYFDEDSKFVMEEYLQSTKSTRMDPNSAYRQAFLAISPERKKLANDFANSAEGRMLIKESVTNITTGFGVDESSARINKIRTEGASIFGIELWRGSIPDNQEIVQAGAHTEAYRYLRSGGSKTGLEDHLKQWARSNFTHDYTSNKLVQVPPGRANKETSEALSAYSEELEGKYGRDAGIRYDYIPGQGTYSIFLDKQKMRLHPDVSLDDLVTKHKSKTSFMGDEGNTLAALQDKAKAGTLTTEDITNNDALITKATALGVWKGEAKKRSDALQTTAAREVGILAKAAKEGRLVAGPISASTGNIPDLAAKRPVAQSMMKSGDVSGALTVMGEGVALKAYKDPAKGTNIGIGYNIDMNIKTAADDFRRAGITASVEDIKEGRVSISTEQAIRLYQVVQPRYTAIAKDAFDKRFKPGAFESLSAPEKAVLTDIAYQSGKNVAKFGELFDQMMNKQHITEEALNLSWKDRNTKKMRLDTHRRDLRVSMLLGKFDLGLKHSGIN